MITRLLYAFERWMNVRRLARWARERERIWKHSAAVDQLKQIVWRLEMGATTVDQRAARELARGLLKRISE